MLSSFFFKRNIGEIITWGLLILLIPTGVAGVFSENSQPGDTLYPLKQTINGFAIGYMSLYNRTLTLQHLSLAAKKFQSADKSILEGNNTKDLIDFKTELMAAQVSAQNIKDPVQKAQVEQQLLKEINQYQDKLIKIQTDLNSQDSLMNSLTYSSVIIPSNTPIQTQTSSERLANSQSGVSNLPTPTNTPSPNGSDTSQVINDVQNQLNQIANNIQNSSIEIPTPTPTTYSLISTPTPTVNLLPSVTPTPILSMQSQQIPTPTSTPSLSKTSITGCGCYISGFPFIDSNNDGHFNNGENYYSYNNKPALTFSIYDQHGNFIYRQTQNNGQTPNSDWYSFNKLPTNSKYTVKLDSVPSGYILTTPQSYTVTVGIPCDIGGSFDAKCTQVGDINQLSFGFIPSSNKNYNNNNGNHGNYNGDN